MAVDDVYRLTLQQRQHAQVVENVLHFRFKTTSATEEGLRTTIAGAFKSAIQAQQAGELSWELARTRGMVPVATDTIESPYSAPLIGALTTDALPGICAAIVSLRTGLSGKSRRGRFYLAGLEFVKEDNGLLQPVYVAAIQAVFDNLVATYGKDGSDPDYEWGVFSRKLGGTLKIGPPPKNTQYYSDPFNLNGFRPIVTAIVRPQIASFVTRKYGRGI